MDNFEFQDDDLLGDVASKESSKNKLLSGLNDSQKEAVSAPLSNMLVIAGAGTGKTRVLVSRIAWLINVCSVEPRNILAVTFTNKAAGEMRERIGLMVGGFLEHQLWASTFHSICLRLLRAYAVPAGLHPNFTILDTDSQTVLVKRIIKDLQFDSKEIKASDVVSRISKLKENRIRAQAYYERGHQLGDPQFKENSQIYLAYEKICQQENSVDFSELLLRTVELLESNEGIRQLQHKRFKEILVDEFQDTNSLQYTFLRLIAGENSHVMVVGDDDQSIYGWRGADYKNMTKFVSEFDNVKEIVLALNYRSSQKILDVANTLIAENDDRMKEKVLKGTSGAGEFVDILNCPTEQYESDYVCKCIEKLHDAGEHYSDIAILYRNNYLSLSFEQRLTRYRIPFVMFGGQKFFERAEILDALAYMRILVNEDDDTAALRIINVPSRKIGPKVITDLRTICEERNCSILKTIKLLQAHIDAGGKEKTLVSLYKKVQPFFALLEDFKSKKETMPLNEFVDYMLRVSGLYEYYQAKDAKEGKSDSDNSRVANLGALVSNVKDFVISLENMQNSADDTQIQENFTSDDADAIDLSQDPLLTYLSNITLVSTGELKEDGSDDNHADAVNMMTIHSSKGLEFKYVFLVGFEAEILPSRRSLESKRGVNEERRLAYVGVTRAKSKLFISYARTRSLFGNTNRAGASDFLRETVATYNGAKEKPYQIINVQSLYS